jgi:lipopolysaccharide assembly outer membrane protein LptD (OstA)
LPLQQTPAPTRKPKGERDVATSGLISVDADKVEHSLTTDTASLTGHVVVRQGDRQMKADQIQLNTQTKDVKAQGNVDYTDPIVHITGARGDYSSRMHSSSCCSVRRAA